MPKFMVVMRQDAEGCDHTIGCGRAYEHISAPTQKKAMEKAKAIFRGDFAPGGCSGRFSGEDKLKWMVLVRVVEDCPIEEWTEEMDTEEAAEQSGELPLGPHLVVCQDWEESERGWGVRPDGYTLHVDEDERDRYVKEYNRKHNNKAAVPDEYTIPSGKPRIVEVEAKVFLEVQRKKSMWGALNGSGPDAFRLKSKPSGLKRMGIG